MITLTTPDRPLDRKLLEHPGGFAWWYLDALNGRGDGLVMIWSFGLPFLPGYTDAARNGKGQPGRERPSLNLVIYEAGTPIFYQLLEFSEHNVEYDDAAEIWRFGDTTIRYDKRNGRRERLVADVDLPIPRSDERLVGRIAADGTERIPTHRDLPSAELHAWSPVFTDCHVWAELALGGEFIRIDAPAYHDRNGSAAHFDALGIAHWTWGRARFDGFDRVWYALWPNAQAENPEILGLDLMADGTTRRWETLRAETPRRSRDFYGMLFWREFDLLDADEPWLRVRHDIMSDRGPFYLRNQVLAELPDGTRSRGWSEYVVPSRVDLPLHRPFVRMRVHRTNARNSMWLPLFCGPRQGRVSRLLRRDRRIPELGVSA